MKLWYEQNGREMRQQNFWGFTDPLPEAFYEGKTGIYPVDYVLQGVRESAYGHHIERLMVLGNIMLLLRIRLTMFTVGFWKCSLTGMTG